MRNKQREERVQEGEKPADERKVKGVRRGARKKEEREKKNHDGGQRRVAG